MKKIILTLMLMILTSLAFSQGYKNPVLFLDKILITNSTRTDTAQLYMDNAHVFHIRCYTCDSIDLFPFSGGSSGGSADTSSLSARIDLKVDTIYKNAGGDSIVFVIDSRRHAFKYGLGDTTSISNRINLKIDSVKVNATLDTIYNYRGASRFFGGIFAPDFYRYNGTFSSNRTVDANNNFLDIHDPSVITLGGTLPKMKLTIDCTNNQFVVTNGQGWLTIDWLSGKKQLSLGESSSGNWFRVDGTTDRLALVAASDTVIQVDGNSGMPRVSIGDVQKTGQQTRVDVYDDSAFVRIDADSMMLIHTNRVYQSDEVMLTRDTTNGTIHHRTIPTGSGSGTVTSVGSGVFMNGGPITGSGTLNNDTSGTGFSGKYWQKNDTIAPILVTKNYYLNHIDTTLIPSFAAKVRSLHSATSPLVYASGTGNFSIPVASGSVNGYLSSAVFNSFNSKQSAISVNAPITLSGETIGIDTGRAFGKAATTFYVDSMCRAFRDWFHVSDGIAYESPSTLTYITVTGFGVTMTSPLFNYSGLIYPDALRVNEADSTFDIGDTHQFQFSSWIHGDMKSGGAIDYYSVRHIFHDGLGDGTFLGGDFIGGETGLHINNLSSSEIATYYGGTGDFHYSGGSTRFNGSDSSLANDGAIYAAMSKALPCYLNYNPVSGATGLYNFTDNAAIATYDGSGNYYFADGQMFISAGGSMVHSGTISAYLGGESLDLKADSFGYNGLYLQSGGTPIIATTGADYNIANGAMTYTGATTTWDFAGNVLANGAWHGSLVTGTYGGTGVNNSTRTITVGGNFSTSSATAILNGSATLNFASTGAGAVADLTVTVTGAAVGDVVCLGVPNGSVTATATFTAWVSSSNTVTVRFSPKATEDPASGTFKVRVIQ